MNYEIHRLKGKGDFEFEVVIQNFDYESFKVTHDFLRNETPLKIVDFFVDKEKATIWLNKDKRYSTDILKDIIDDAMKLAVNYVNERENYRKRLNPEYNKH